MKMLKITEQQSHYQHLENMQVREVLELINKEDTQVPLAVKACIPRIEELVEGVVERMRNGGRLFYLGAGTSGRMGVLDASEIPPTYGAPEDRVIGLIAGGDTAIRKAVEGAEDDLTGGWRDLLQWNICKEDSLVGIAASGTTPYVVGAVQRARQEGIFTGCITSNPGSPLAFAAQVPIVAVVGPEFVTGSTRMKAGTAQKLILNMISTSVMIRLGHVSGSSMVDMQLTNDKLVDRGARMIMQQTGLNDYAQSRELLLRYGSVRKAVEALK